MWNDCGFELESMKWIMVCDADEWSDRCHRVTHISIKGFVTLFGQLVRNAAPLVVARVAGTESTYGRKQAHVDRRRHSGGEMASLENE